MRQPNLIIILVRPTKQMMFNDEVIVQVHSLEKTPSNNM